MLLRLVSLTVLCCCAAVSAAFAAELFEMQDDAQSRWTSFENPTGAKGGGGISNKGAKGAAFEPVAPGEIKVLLDVQGSGTIHRMWVTLRSRDPESLRSYVVRMYWDGAEKPAVEAPFGDFFGAILGRPIAFQGELFANPEGRSFNCFVPMPFRTGARITFTNESVHPLEQLFYDVNYTLNSGQPEEALYFHAYWHRVRATGLGQDFELLPKITGRGRYLGTHVGVIGASNVLGWWGEGEVKVYLDGDTQWPTLVGTGTEDYIATAYGQGEFSHRYSGSLVVDNKKRQWTFYRYHVPDPVFFHEDVRVTIQQMGGTGKDEVVKMLGEGVEIQPVTINPPDSFVRLQELEPLPDLTKDPLPEGWTNFYRRDDVSAVAFFYLDRPASELPPIAPLEERIAGLLGE